MRILLWVTFLSLVACVACKNHFFGVKTKDSKLVHRKRIFLEAFPFRKRIDYFEYSNSTLPIKAVYCYDYQFSESSVNVTDGGVGFHHVALRLKSQRSYRLDFAIEVYS